MKYLNDEQLKGFESYKYNCIDTSVLSTYVMHPFWNWCVQFCPRWVSPNLLTFTGFLLTIMNFLIFTWYDYDFNGAHTTDVDGKNSIPRWTWAVTSISLFIAYTLDGIDGKQARKTGTSGPLGELFDHGLDSYTSVLIPATVYSAFGRNFMSPIRMYFIVWLVFTNFYVPHWEKYNTGVMFLPWGYDFTMVSIVLALMATYVIGPSAWNTSLMFGVRFSLVIEITLYSTAVLTGYTIMFWNVYKSYKDKTGKMRPITEAMGPLVPYTFFFIISTLWAVYSPNNIVDEEPRIFFLLLGTVFSNISCRLIVAQMSNTKCDIFNALFYPYMTVIAFVLTIPIQLPMELMFLYTLTAIFTIIHLHYGVGVVSDMCEHFKIKCFKITKKES